MKLLDALLFGGPPSEKGPGSGHYVHKKGVVNLRLVNILNKWVSDITPDQRTQLRKSKVFQEAVTKLSSPTPQPLYRGTQMWWKAARDIKIGQTFNFNIESFSTNKIIALEFGHGALMYRPWGGENDEVVVFKVEGMKKSFDPYKHGATPQFDHYEGERLMSGKFEVTRVQHTSTKYKSRLTDLDIKNEVPHYVVTLKAVKQ